MISPFLFRAEAFLQQLHSLSSLAPRYQRMQQACQRPDLNFYEIEP
jgi:HD-like signal output (HDOD) protein